MTCEVVALTTDSPGTLCTPPQIGCNFERNPPGENYVCAPEECKPVPPIPDYVNSSSPGRTDADCAWYVPPPGFFNLNPEDFGLTYAIFDIYGQPVCEEPSKDWGDAGWGDSKGPKGKPPRRRRTRRTNNPLAHLVQRQAGSIIYAPADCYPEYNAASIIGQGAGYRYPNLCEPGTSFQEALEVCRSCAAASSESIGQRTYHELQDYVDWCEDNQPTGT